LGATIIGTGAYLPGNRITNAELVRRGVNTTERWIVSHTGIHQRFWAEETEATSDLAVKAAQVALERAGVHPRELLLTICATSSPDYPLPATAGIVQHRLGASGGAYDINAVCSGFVSALATGFAICEQAQTGPVLVIGADTYSRWLDIRNRNTAVFFGDGAGAVVIAPGSQKSLLSTSLVSDGALHDKIIVEMGGSRRPATRAGLAEGQMTIHMDGRAVWEYATRSVPALVRQTADRAGLRLSDLDWLIPHQANERLIEALLAALQVPRSRAVLNVQRVANTAAASIPIALDEAVERGQVTRGQSLLLVGFGGGMAGAAVCLRW